MIENQENGKPKGADMQFDAGSAEYVQLAELDPNKQYVQYPEALRLMGDLNGKEVLDIGCGNGTLTRMMARRGAKVVAYDPSERQIKTAQTEEDNDKLGIKYFVADRPALNSDQKFDIASAILVLPLAADKKQLEEMFRYAADALKENGKFVAITLNPNYKRFGEIAHNRRFTMLGEGSKMRVEFLDDKGQVKLDIVDNCFPQKDYEQAIEKAGFGEFSWEKLHIDPEGVSQKGAEFWEKFEEDCPYIGLVAYKK